MCLGIIRIDLECLAKSLQGFTVAALALERSAEVVVSQGIARVQPGRLRITGRRGVHISLGLERPAQIQVKSFGLGPKRHRLAQAGHCGRRIRLIEKGEDERMVRGSVSRLQAQRFLETSDGLGGSAGLASFEIQNAQQVTSIRVQGLLA